MVSTSKTIASTPQTGKAATRVRLTTTPVTARIIPTTRAHSRPRNRPTLVTIASTPKAICSQPKAVRPTGIGRDCLAGTKPGSSSATSPMTASSAPTSARMTAANSTQATHRVASLYSTPVYGSSRSRPALAFDTVAPSRSRSAGPRHGRAETLDGVGHAGHRGADAGERGGTGVRLRRRHARRQLAGRGAHPVDLRLELRPRVLGQLVQVHLELAEIAAQLRQAVLADVGVAQVVHRGLHRAEAVAHGGPVTPAGAAPTQECGDRRSGRHGTDRVTSHDREHDRDRAGDASFATDEPRSGHGRRHGCLPAARTPQGGPGRGRPAGSVLRCRPAQETSAVCSWAVFCPSSPCRAACSWASASLESDDLSTVPPYLAMASTALSGVTLSTTRKRAEVPGWSISRTWSWNCLSIAPLVILPMRAPRPAPTAMPRNGTKNSTPNSSPQNIPQVAPPPTALWLVVTWNLPSRSRMITATASGWMMRSFASWFASSDAAVAVVSSGYPMATRVAMMSALPFAARLGLRRHAATECASSAIAFARFAS